MNAEQHRQKAEFIEHSLAKCGPRDWEMKIEAAMLAGTHWTNYALHLRRLTLPDEDIALLSASAVKQLARDAMAESKLLRDLSEIEALRPLYVRGDVPGAQAAALRALNLLMQIGDRARALSC